MIVTVTPNPALDLTLTVPHIELHQPLRATAHGFELMPLPADFYFWNVVTHGPDGVALAGIQALHLLVEARDREIEALPSPCMAKAKSARPERRAKVSRIRHRLRTSSCSERPPCDFGMQ